MSAVLEAHEPSARPVVTAAPALVQKFEILAKAPGGVSRLRDLILSLAVQGKLVPQDPSDEPALQLLKTISAEKDRLIAAGRVKPDKTLSAAIDPHPFEIPQTWAWVPMGEVVEIVRGITFPASEKTREAAPGRIACLRTANVQEAIEWNDLLFVDRSFMAREDQLLKLHDIVMSMANSRELVGKVALVDSIPHAECTFGGFLGVLRPWRIDPRYAMALLRSSYARSTLIDSSSQTTNIANISLGKLRPLPFPLPPLAEQARIVARVDELMRLCDALEAKDRLEAEQHARLLGTLLGTLTDSGRPEELAANWQRVADHFDLLLDRPEAVDALEQTILQLAVRGLLVPQNSSDQPASVSVEQLRSATGRQTPAVRRGGAGFSASDDHSHADLPASWKSVRLSDICTVITDGEHATPERCEDATQVPLVTAKNVRSESMDYTRTDFVPRRVAEQCWRRCKPEPGDILMVSVGATLGRLCVLWDSVEMVLVRSVTLIRPAPDVVDARYLALHLMSPDSQAGIWQSVKQSAQPCLYLAKSAALRIALPPLREQLRIVARVSELRRLCADLRQRLERSSATQGALADALIDQALAA